MLCKQSISPKSLGNFTQKNFNFSPPPPPDGRPDRWDLQFCRFWGWNWVLRGEANEVDQSAMTNALKRSTPNEGNKSNGKQKVKRKNSAGALVGTGPLQPLPTKQQLRELCKCIFKPQRKYLPSCMKDGFQTPSQNTFQWNSKCAKQESNTYKKRVSSYDANERQRYQQDHMRVKNYTGSVDQMTIDTNEFKQTNVKPTYCKIVDRSVDNIKGWRADKEVYCRRSCCNDGGSTTDGSIEYVSLRIMNGQCCPCCHDSHKSKSTNEQGVEVKRYVSTYNLEVQTSQPQLIKDPATDKDTQTPVIDSKTVEISTKNPPEEKLIKLNKKKVICLCVCCCCCSKQDATSSIGQKPKDDETRRCSKCQRKRLESDADQIPEKHMSFAVNKINNELVERRAVTKDSEPDSLNINDKVSYNNVIPPPNSKAFSKFGTPSKSYSWMKAITSDNTDSSQYQFYRSPLTGKTYDLSSVNIDDQFKLTLPDAIDVSDDLVYLKQLDKSWKSDKESRLVLDAVCDAIISEHEDNVKREQVNDLLVNDSAPNDWKNAGYEVKKLNNIFDEIFNLALPSDNKAANNVVFPVSHKGGQWKTDSSINNLPSIKKSLRVGKKRSLYRGTTETVSKKIKSDQITTSKTSKSATSNNKIDDIFEKIGSIINENDKTTEKIPTPLKALSQTSFPKSQSTKSLQTHSKIYPMSSDILQNDLTLFESKPNENDSKRSYEIFSNNRNAYIMPEESTIPSECHKQAEDLDNIVSEELIKVNRLSVQSFLVCDMKSSETNYNDRSILSEKKISKKKKSKSSLIPIRRKKY